MRHPKNKVLNKLSSHMFIRIYHQALILEYDNKLFEKPIRCPKCNSYRRTKYDMIKRIFCMLITKKGFREIKVSIKRYKCKKCGYVYNAKSPFYPRCDYSKPLIDFCLFLSAKHPYNRVENILMNLFGIQVDRDTIRLYAIRFKERLDKIAGIKLFDKDVGINFIRLFFDVSNVKELKKKYKLKAVESATDETYPAKKGAKKKFKMENKELKRQGKPQKRYPDSFTTSFSYLPKLNCFASLLISNNPFSSLFAYPLLKPTYGCDYGLMDGHGAYNDFRDVNCLFHFFKNECKKDKHLKELQKNGSTREIREYLSSKYQEMKKKLVKRLKKKYPDFVDPGGNFTGAVTTNAIEGGNWRVKYELRTPYLDDNSITARTALICILDSIYTFRHGKPDESFAHTHTSFMFEDVMSVKIKKEKIKTGFVLPQPEFNPLSIRYRWCEM